MDIPGEAAQRVTRHQLRFSSFFVHILCPALIHLVPNASTLRSMGNPLETLKF